MSAARNITGLRSFREGSRIFRFRHKVLFMQIIPLNEASRALGPVDRQRWSRAIKAHYDATIGARVPDDMQALVALLSSAPRG